MTKVNELFTYMNDIHTPDDIIDELKCILDIRYDNELADYLNVSKQSLYQYKKKVQPDIQQRIISELLVLMKDKDL